MKKTLLISLLSACLGVSAQQIRIGKIFPNEIRPTLKTNRNFNYNFMSSNTAEVFIRIPEGGRYRIIINEQEIESSTGMFRFFDLEEGSHTLSILEDDFTIYRTRINLRNNHRLVFDFFYYDGLFLLEDINLNNISGLDKRGNRDRNYLSPYGKSVMSSNDFSQFFSHFKKQSFDKEKLETFRMQNLSTAFSTAQIISLMKEMSFDDQKLVLAKEAYPYCIDQENYYKVADAFTFSSNSWKLKDFVKNYR